MSGFVLDFEDRLYEAAAVPELWPGVLAEFMKPVGGRGSVLVVKRGDNINWVASSQEFAALVAEHYNHPDGVDRTARLLRRQHPGFMTEADLWNEDELAANRLYRDILIPKGFGRSAATAVFAPPDDTYVFHAEGPFALGPIPSATIAALDNMRPHLARAALLSAKLGLERARAMAHVLELLDFPGAILSYRGKPIATTAQFEAMIPNVLRDHFDRVRFSNPRLDEVFWSSFEATVKHGKYLTPLSFPMAASEERPACVVHVIPLRGAANDIFVGGAALLIFAVAGGRQLSDASILQGLFDLTPAEARVAKALGEGQTIAEIARRTGAKATTVRVHLRRVFEKTGAERQADLITLMQGTSISARTSPR